MRSTRHERKLEKAIPVGTRQRTLHANKEDTANLGCESTKSTEFGRCRAQSVRSALSRNRRGQGGCPVHRQRDGNIRRRRHLLDPPDGLSHRLRCRWRRCIDKFDRQSWRLCRPVCYWLDQRCDWRSSARPGGAGCLFDHVRRPHISDGPPLENGNGGQPCDGGVSRSNVAMK
jgi:hypothetical protein